MVLGSPDSSHLCQKDLGIPLSVAVPYPWRQSQNAVYGRDGAVTPQKAVSKCQEHVLPFASFAPDIPNFHAAFSASNEVCNWSRLFVVCSKRFLA